MKVTDEQIQKELAAGKNHLEIAEKYDLHPQSIRDRFRAMGIDFQDARKLKRSNRVVHQFSVSPELLEKVDQLSRKTNKLKAEVLEEAVDLYYRRVFRSKK